MAILRDSKDPRQVGDTWFNGYWGLTYEVRAMRTQDGTTWINVRWEDGTYGTHCTGVDSRRDRLVSRSVREG